MKIVFIVIAVLVLVFIFVQVFAIYSQKGIETYDYEVVRKFENFEIRSYEKSLFTSVKLPGSSYKKMSSKGFSMLAAYIFGGNDSNEKIAMTSPVSMSLEDSMTMGFLVPQKYEKEDLPKPNQSNIEIKEQAQRRMAAITFGGWADDSKIEKNKKKLIASLEENGITYTNKFYMFGYNAPYELFNRKNEIVVELPEEK
ncbi:heme-binding protein [Marivirga harenae]|uniref:SOUL family heme-binding protein n=1 Tax=Marivirga harenae TaxID=2010992 RepID=UPI0026DEE84F|nr:heme-binding protein [Marivirga harenae]WKV12452.1 heme-binding protein [Marivirga harenae]|tara:strand:+ start:82148 stop:82741 length:594 start_codon:yes stop_codon:yes gene_type:complete